MGLLTTGRRGRAGLLFAGSLCAVVAAGAVFGQVQNGRTEEQNEAPETGALQEVIVTARKRAENIQDIPASIVAISGATIEEAHLTQIDDIGSQVSNLYIVQRNDNSPDVTLRGVGSFGVVQGVGFYVNDVQLFEGQIIRPYDIERIEVLKGPQGTLYGGANIGGAIKYVTKEPTFTWENQASAEFGDIHTRNYFAVLSGPLVGDELAARVSLYDERHGGYIYDTFRKTEFGDTFDRGGRATLLYQPNEGTKVHLHLSVDDFSTSAQNLLYTPPNDDTYLYSVNDYYVPSFLRKLWSTTLQVDQQLDSQVALTSISSFFSSYNRGLTDFAKQPVPIDALQQNQDHRVWSQELRLASSGGGSLDWLLGLYYQEHKTQLLSMDNFSTGDVNNPIVVGTDLDVDQKRQRQYAIFADLTYHWNAWQAELGLRGEYYQSSIAAYNNGYVPPLSASAALHGRELSPRGSLQYKLAPETNLYATISRGFEPADEIEENGEVHSYRAEIATSYEIGLKSLLADRVQFNAAVFYIDYANRLYQNIQFTPTGIVEVTSNIGPSKNYGAEFDAAANIGYGFKLSGGAGVIRALWGNTPFIDPQTDQPINLDGRTAPFTPAYTGNAVISWNHRLAGGYELSARADASFIGSSWWDPQDSTRQRAYQILNLGTALEKGRWTLAAHASNLTRAKYNTIYDASYDVGAPFNVAHVGRPREFVVSGTVHF